MQKKKRKHVPRTSFEEIAALIFVHGFQCASRLTDWVRVTPMPSQKLILEKVCYSITPSGNTVWTLQVSLYISSSVGGNEQAAVNVLVQTIIGLSVFMQLCSAMFQCYLHIATYLSLWSDSKYFAFCTAIEICGDLLGCTLVPESFVRLE